MKHLFVPYEIAVILKEKGFDEPCLKYVLIDKNGVPHKTDTWLGHFSNTEQRKDRAYIPLYQQVIDWLREKRGLVVGIDFDTKYFFWFINYINGTNKIIQGNFSEYPDYYQSLTKAIEEALKLI